MSTPVNSLNNLQVRPNILTTVEPISDGRSNTFLPFLQLDKFDLGRIRVSTPPVATPQTETYGLHDEHEQETGQTVTFDASDPGSLFSTAEQLAKSPSSQDKIKAQELFMKFQELLQLQIQKASILHDMAMSAIKAMRG